METLQNIVSQQIIQKLGWTLIHFVWQGLLATLLLAVALRFMRRQSSNLRYITACMVMVVMIFMPVITFRTISVFAPAITPQAITVNPLQTTDTPPQIEMPKAEKIVNAGQVTLPKWTLKDRFIKTIESLLPHIVIGWLIGVFVLSIWYLGGWTQLQRLRRQMVKQVTPAIKAKLKQLSQILGIRKAITIAESALVNVPTVIGHLKPIILLPASALTGLSSEQIEAILAHELAHIKRCDYPVNILQTVVEILGFYHPAVWWVSNKIRIERENCCDDLAVEISGDKVCYAEALTTMEEIRAGQLGLVMAASGGNLFNRICRLLGKDMTNNEKAGRLPSVITMAIVMLLLISVGLAVNNKPEVIEAQFSKTGIVEDNINEIESLDPNIKELGEAVKKKLTTYSDGEIFTLQDSETANMKVKENIAGVAEILITPHIAADGTKFDLKALDDKGNPVTEYLTTRAIHDGDSERTGSNILKDGKQILCKIQLSPTRQGTDGVIVAVKMLFTELSTWEELQAMLLTRGKEGRVQLDFADISTRIIEYKEQHGSYPESLEDLNQPLPKDVYSQSGQSYHYESNQKRFILSSCGEDGVYSNNDDKVSIYSSHGALTGLRHELYPLKENEEDKTQNESFGPTGRRPTGNCSISGKVVSAETNEPVSNATVYLFCDKTFDVIFINVASDGSFEFKKIPNGPFSLRTVHTAGFQDTIYNPESSCGDYPQFTLKDGEQRTGVVLRLERAYTVSGKVLDENGRPFNNPNCLVMVWHQSSKTGKPGGIYNPNGHPSKIASDGSYHIDALDGSPVYVMVINRSNPQEENLYPPIYYPSTFSQDEAKPITFGTEKQIKNIDIKMKKSGGIVLKGTVKDEKSRPISDAFVVVHHRDMLFDFITAYTDENGRYKIDALGPGEFLVHVDAVQKGYVRKREPIDIKASDKKLNQDFILNMGATISGRFVDESGNEWQNTNGFGNAEIRNTKGVNSSFSQTNFRNKYRPKDTVDSSGGLFLPGQGNYNCGEMICPTPGTFIFQGMMPGQTMITFAPKEEGYAVKEIRYNGQNIMETGIETKPGDEIKGITIVIGEETKK